MRFRNLLLLTFIMVIVLGSLSVIGVNAWVGDTCPEGTTGEYPFCLPIETCPPGTTGTPPYCLPETCPPGTTGTPPLCIPDDSCPPGTLGTPPICIPYDTCPSGTTGTPPNCVAIETCPDGTTGEYPVCEPIAVPTLEPKPLGSLDDQGICKFTEVKGGVVGESIMASGKGYPSVMRLKVDGIIYLLPVIESTIVMDFETNSWKAEFATVDPNTSQPLVPAGEYEVGCFGANGTADGTGNKIMIK